jgi:AraC family transcriptional regulator of arabinose operon
MPQLHRPEIIAAGRALQLASHRFRRGPGFPYASSACLVTGSARLLLLERNEVVLRAPCLVQIAPRTPYLLSAADRHGWEEIWVISSPTPDQEAAVACWPMPAPGLRLLELASDPVAVEIIAAAAGIPVPEDPARPERQTLQENAWERVLLLARGARARQPSSLPNALVAAAQAHLAVRLAQRHSLGALARALAISPSHLSELFRLQLGEAPMRHLRRMRIARARILLLGTSRPVEAIAREVGFDDPGHFSSVFRRLVGCPPRSYRKQGDGLARPT